MYIEVRCVNLDFFHYLDMKTFWLYLPKTIKIGLIKPKVQEPGARIRYTAHLEIALTNKKLAVRIKRNISILFSG